MYVADNENKWQHGHRTYRAWRIIKETTGWSSVVVESIYGRVGDRHQSHHQRGGEQRTVSGCRQLSLYEMTAATRSHRSSRWPLEAHKPHRQRQVRGGLRD